MRLTTIRAWGFARRLIRGSYWGLLISLWLCSWRRASLVRVLRSQLCRRLVGRGRWLMSRIWHGRRLVGRGCWLMNWLWHYRRLVGVLRRNNSRNGGR